MQWRNQSERATWSTDQQAGCLKQLSRQRLSVVEWEEVRGVAHRNPP